MIGPDEWVDVFLYAGYYEQTWLQLGSAFAGFVHNGDRQLPGAWAAPRAPGR